MKKIYLPLFLLLTIFTVRAQVPTCTYDYTWLALGKNGIYPDSATNFAGGIVGSPYLQNVTIKIPYDTVTSLGTFHYNHVDLKTNVNPPVNYGLPPGLSLVGTPSNLKFPGNDTSCLVIYGTPTTAGTYMLTFKLDVWLTEFSFAPYTTQTIGYYKIIVAPANGIATNGTYTFHVMQNSPNPVRDNASITFTSSNEGKAKLCVFDVTGQKVMEKEMSAQRGDNNFDVDAAKLESGIYLYTVEMNQQKQCRRMVIAH